MDIEKRWSKFQQALGYSADELKGFRTNPKWVKMVEDAKGFSQNKIIAEVVSSHGCIAQHKVGDKIVMDANGVLLRDECPERMCVSAIAPLSHTFTAICERLAENLDPNGICFKHVGCTDLGPECGGWGKVIMRIEVVPLERR